MSAARTLSRNTVSCVSNPLSWRRGESNDTRLLILRNLLQTYQRKNRKTRCMAASIVQNHVQKFEGRVSRRPLSAGLRSCLPVYRTASGSFPTMKQEHEA